MAIKSNSMSWAVYVARMATREVRTEFWLAHFKGRGHVRDKEKVEA